MFIHHQLVKSLAVPYLLLNGVQSLFEGLLIHSELLLEIVCVPDPCPKHCQLLVLMINVLATAITPNVSTHEWLGVAADCDAHEPSGSIIGTYRPLLVGIVSDHQYITES